MKLRVFLIFALLVLILTACNSDTNEKKEAPSPSVTTEAPSGEILPQQAQEYKYPDLKYNGEDFTILNYTTEWGFYTDIVFEEEPDEILNESVYRRNQTIEDKFNLKLAEINRDIFDLPDYIRKTNLTGEDIYAAFFTPIHSVSAMITSNTFYNLDEIPHLQLDQPWWNQNLRGAVSIGKKSSMYFASCDTNLTALQAVFCIYFNENMLENLGLDRPYNLVKEGKWTYNKFYEYVKAGTNLNGDDDFSTTLSNWKKSGSSIYGMTTYANFSPAMIFASGENYFVKDENNMPYLTPGSERLTSVFQSLADMMKNKGEFLHANVYGDAGFLYISIFEKGRALLMSGELVETFNLRAMEDTFGILPMPKYNEQQKEYHSMQWDGAPVMGIFTSREDTEKSGAVMDALAYLSYETVTPVFFDVSMTHKKLRNDESVEMMKLIRGTIFFDIGAAYGWTSRLSLAGEMLWTGNGAISTLLARVGNVVQKEIDKTIEFFQ